MIGVALVVFVGVFSSSLKASVNETLDEQFAGDLSILNKDGFSPIPSGIADEVAEIEGVDVVAPIAIGAGGDRGHGRRPAPRRARATRSPASRTSIGPTAPTRRWQAWAMTERWWRSVGARTTASRSATSSP